MKETGKPSPMTPESILASARAQMQVAFNRARAGDQGELNRLRTQSNQDEIITKAQSMASPALDDHQIREFGRILSVKDESQIYNPSG